MGIRSCRGHVYRSVDKVWIPGILGLVLKGEVYPHESPGDLGGHVYFGIQMYGVPLPCIGVRPSPLTVMAVTNDARSGTAWRAVSGLRANKKGSHGHRYDRMTKATTKLSLLPLGSCKHLRYHRIRPQA